MYRKIIRIIVDILERCAVWVKAFDAKLNVGVPVE